MGAGLAIAMPVLSGVVCSDVVATGLGYLDFTVPIQSSCLAFCSCLASGGIASCGLPSGSMTRCDLTSLETLSVVTVYG